MNPSDRPPLDTKAKIDNTLTVTQSGEKTIFVVKKHPIGLVPVYSICGVLTITVAFLAFVAAPHINSNGGNGQATALAMVAFLFVAILCAGFSLLVTKIYTGNSWTLTTDSVTQVVQNNLFDRESSQLSLHNLEDISAEQNGFFPHLFNYGQIKVETAGEKSKFTLNYCPNPNLYAQQILAARESFLLSHREALTQDLTGSKYNTLNLQSPPVQEKLQQQPEHKPILGNANFLDPAEVELVRPVVNPVPPNFQPPQTQQAPSQQFETPKYPPPPDYEPPQK